jgi:predicted acyl esterase
LQRQPPRARREQEPGGAVAKENGIVHRRLSFVALAVAVAALVAGALGPARAAAPAFTKQTFQVPVTQPDNEGRAVTLDTDVYLPAGTPPAHGWPLVEVFHGGGSDKANAYDAGHAQAFAAHGYLSFIYSQRGNASSGGEEAVAGPQEMHDLFDVTNWVEHHFAVDKTKIALSGYSQGGLNTNLGQVWAADKSINPYGISFAALLPGNTPDLVFDALVPNGVVKLSVGAGLVATYGQGPKYRVSPLLGKWIATSAADEPALFGDATEPCALDPHDTATSTMRADLAWRSVGCQPGRMALPWLWAQAFDDEVFPAQMAINLQRAAPNRSSHPLYLSMGGHTAPAAAQKVEDDKFAAQLAFVDHVLRGAKLRNPPVVYWTRDPRVAVPGSSYRYPDTAWIRQTAAAWPPPGTGTRSWQLGADGKAVERRNGAATSGPLPLASLSSDEARDTVAATLMTNTPLGTSPVPSQLPPTDAPGLLARFATPAFTSTLDLDGASVTRLVWTPATPDTQLVVKVFDVGPDGTLTLLSRGVDGIRGATPGQAQTVTMTGSTMSARVFPGHHLETWVSAGDVAFFKPYAGSAGGVLSAGPDSTLTLPLRPAS